MPTKESVLLADIGLYIPVFPTVLHSVVAHESMQIILLYSTSSAIKNETGDFGITVEWRQDGRLELVVLSIEFAFNIYVPQT